MNTELRKDAEAVARGAISAICPDDAVRRALQSITLIGNIYVVAVGKAAWQMAAAALKYLEQPVQNGIVLTKYGHCKGELPGLSCQEACHPVPDDNSYQGTREILALLAEETPKSVPNVHTQIIGSVRELCRAAEKIAKDLGYEVVFLTDQMDGEASEEGRRMADLLYRHRSDGKNMRSSLVEKQ